MKKIGSYLITTLIAVVFFSVSASAAQAAGYLKFDKSTISVAAGDTFQIQVIVNPGTDEIAGTDAHVTYNATLLEAQTVTAGTYFPTVSNNIASGKVSIWGTTVPASPKSGEGTIATITFKALANGSATLQYFCDAAASNSSKVVKADINATNIIDCTQDQSSAVTVSGTGSSGTVPTPTTVLPTALPQSGGFDGTAPIAVGGFVLLIAGALFRYIKL